MTKLTLLLLLHTCAGTSTTTYIRTSTGKCALPGADKGVSVELFPDFVTTSISASYENQRGPFELHFEDKDPTTGRPANSTGISPVVATGSIAVSSTNIATFTFSGFCAVNCAGRECGFLNSAYCDCTGIGLDPFPYQNGTINLICKVDGNTACAGTYEWTCPDC